MSIHIDLKQLAIRESERVEWKARGDDRDVVVGIVKTIVAFANDLPNFGGGYVVCGAQEAQDEHGFPTVSYTGLTASEVQAIEGQVLAHCRDRVSPSLAPIVEELPCPELPDRRLLVFVVLCSPQAHTYRDHQNNPAYYVRTGRATREARNGILRQLLVQKQQIQPFDKRPCATASEQDIDAYYFREQLSVMGLLRSDKDAQDYFSDREQIAELVPPLFVRPALEDRLLPKNFALLLFGKRTSITSRFTEAHTILSVYPGKDRSQTAAERHELTGPLPEQARRAIELLNGQAYTAFDKTSDKPNQVKYPVRALQEAVVNAIVHRDYEIPEPIRITVFSDRIEVRSPGALHWAVDKTRFLEGKAGAKWRNQSFAYLFNKLQLAQSEGQGIPTIFGAMREEGCPEPYFELEADSVACVLPAHPRHQTIRELQAIQDMLILGNYDQALSKVNALLDNDVYNFRALDLFCEIALKLQSPRLVFDLATDKQLDPSRINPNTLVNMAEVLSLSRPQTPKEYADLASKLFSIAVLGKLEEGQVERAAISYKKVAAPQDLIHFVDLSMRNYPHLSQNPTLLQKRATARMDMAKECINTARDRRSNPRTKLRAWELCRELLAHAQSDLDAALRYVRNPSERFFVEKDLDFLDKMQQIAKKPSK